MLAYRDLGDHIRTRVDEETEVERAGDGTPIRGNGAASNGEEWVGEAGPLTDVTHPELTTDTLLIESSCRVGRSEEHTSELQSLMRISYAVFCLKKKNKQTKIRPKHIYITQYDVTHE